MRWFELFCFSNTSNARIFWSGNRRKFYSYKFEMACVCIFQFLLSEHILCKKNVVIVKKFDTEILTYLYILRSPEFIYPIFAVMYECVCACVYVRVCVCVCVCMWVNTSKRYIRLSSNLGCILKVTIRRTLLILVNAWCIVYFYRSAKIILICYCPWSQIIVSVQVSESCIPLIRNLVLVLTVIVLHTIPILVTLGLKAF